MPGSRTWTPVRHRSLPTSSPRRPAARPLVLALQMALAGACLQAAVLPTAARAQAQAQAARAFDIPAGPLAATLNHIGETAGLLLSFDPAQVKGRTAPAIKGQLTATQALDKALAGSGLEAVADGPSVVVRPAPATQGVQAPSLPAVTVRAKAEQDTATGPVQGYLATVGSTATKTDTPVRETPQSISVVTRDSMNARGVSSLAESLEYAPGFTATAYGQDDRYDWSLLRGIGDTNNGIFRDGLKERGSVYAVPKTNTYGLERVEFLRGPASLLFGSTIPGGVVNGITKRPTAEARGEVRVRAGSMSRRGVAADVSGPLDQDGTVLWRLVALDEKYDLATPQTTKHERYFAPAVTFRFSPDTELTLLANYQQDRIDGDAYPYGYSESVGYYVPAFEKRWDRFNRDQWSAGVLLDHRFGEDLSVHSRTRYGHTKLDYRLAYAIGQLSETLIDRAAQYIKDKGRILHTDNYLEAKWGGAGWRNTSIVGIDYSKVRAALLRGDGYTTPYDLATGRSVGSFVEPVLLDNYRGTTRQTGLYAQNQARIADSYVIVAGLRHDDYREDAFRSGTPDTTKHKKVTGRLGGVWLLTPEVSPYVSYSTSFQPSIGATFDGTPFKPTLGRQYEVGVRYEPQGLDARFTAAWFDIRQQNVQTADPLHQDFNIQRGEIGSRGLELEAVASLPYGVDLTASYSYTDARVTKDTDPGVVGLRNGLVPRHKLAAWADWRLPPGFVDGLSLGLGLRHNSKVPDFDNTRWVPGVTVLDARLGWRMDRWELALNVRNLLDKQYLVNCSYGSCYPAEEREVIATLNYRW